MSQGISNPSASVLITGLALDEPANAAGVAGVRERNTSDLEPSDAQAVTVFLSYSRSDSLLMQRIADALEASGYRPNYDTAAPSAERPDVGISAQDEWWQRLQDMIVAADMMVLLVSPASSRSRIVDEEIAFARGEGKRIVPVLCNPVDFETAPPRLAALNVRISFVDRAPEAFATSMQQLRTAIDQDIEWYRAGRALNQKAHEWRMAKRAPDRLLHGEEIVEAELWSVRRPISASAIGDDTLAFVVESRAAQEARMRDERTRLTRQRRMQRWLGALIVSAFVATLVGAGFVFDRQQRLAHSESVMLARVAEESFTRGDHVRALRLGALGLRDGLLQPGSPEAQSVFDRSALSPVLERELPTRASVVQDWVAADASVAAMVDGGGYSLSFWRIETGARVAGDTPDLPKSDVAFTVSPSGRRFLSWGIDLKSGYAFADGSAKDRARYGILWGVTADGDVVSLRTQSHPIQGGLLPSDGGQIVTWGGTSVDVWSAEFDKRLDGTRLPAPVMTGSIFDNGRRLVLLLENGSVEVWSLDPRGKLARLAVAPLVARQSPGYLTVVAKENLLLLVTRSGELIALDLLTLAPRYRGVVQECCTGPPIVKMRRDTKDGAPESLLLNVVPQVGARLIRIATGEIVGPTFHHEGIRGASFDENGEHLVTYGTDDRAHIWRVDGGTRVGTISHADQLGAPTGQYLPRGGIRGAVFLPGSAEVVLWNYDGTVRVHAVASGKQIGGHMRHLGPVFDVLLLPDNRVLSASNGPVRIWRLPNYALPISSKEGLCTSRWPRLHTVRLARQELGGSAVSVTLYKNGSAELAPALSVDEEDVRLAPILNGRQSEALCGTRK